MTHQTDAPIEHMSLNMTARTADGLIQMVKTGDLAWEGPHVPYQRGAVWTRDQQIQLIASALSGTPIPAIILNRRDWERCGPDDPYYVVIDGQQRLRAFAAWYDGELAVPASWWPSDLIEQTRDTEDGPYVTFDGLTVVGRRFFNRRVIIPVAEASVRGIRAEAEVYLRVNGYGTAQTDEDMANAARVAVAEEKPSAPKRLSQKAVHEAIKATNARPLVDYVGQVLRDGGPRYTWVRLKDRFEDPRTESPAAAALIAAFEANGWTVTHSTSEVCSRLDLVEG